MACMLIQYISQPATPEAKISHIGLIFRKYTPAKVMAHIMILMLFFPKPTSPKFSLFIIKMAADKISPAIMGFMVDNVVFIIKFSLFFNKNFKTMNSNSKEGNTKENVDNKEPAIPPMV